SGAGQIVTDGNTLVVIDRESGQIFKSTNDGATWTQGQSLPGYSRPDDARTAVVNGVLHVIQVSGSGSASYQRVDVATGSLLPVTSPPVVPNYQWNPFIL